MHRTAFILFISFISLIAIAGFGTLYFTHLNRGVQQILLLNNSQLHAMNEMSDNFRFLKQSQSEVSDKAKIQIMGSIINTTNVTMSAQKEIENYGEEVKKSHFWASLDWNEQSLGLSPIEQETIGWLRDALISDQASASLVKSGEPRPMENYTLNLKGWRQRILEQNAIISTFSDKINTIQNRLILACFSGLGFVFGLMYFLILRPMISQFERNAKSGERLLSLQKEISFLNSKILQIDTKIISDPEKLISEIKEALSNTASLNQIIIRQSPEEIAEHFLIEAPIHGTDFNFREIHFYVPNGFTEVKNELYSLANNLSHYIGIISEVNLRLKAETQRDAYHQIVQIAVQSLPNPIAIFDNFGAPIMFNPSFASFFSIETIEPNSLTLGGIEALHEKLIAKPKPNAVFFGSGKPAQETLNYKNSTSFIWTKLPIFDTGLMFIAQDITIAKRNLQKTEHDNRLQELGRISGTVAHDSNNFLSVIMNSLEFLKYESELSKDHIALLDHAILTCAQASKMNKQLVSYASRQNLAPESLSIKEIADKAHEFFTANNKHRVRFLIHYQTDRNVLADRIYLHSAICNVIRNALETVLPEGKIELTFSDASNQQISITIEDDGPGFSEAALLDAKLPFFSEKSFGTGLGLAAVDGFARQTGGSLSLSNSLGAKVELLLPAHHIEAQSMPASSIISEETTGLIFNKTILLLEDNIHLGKLINKFLSRHGCNIIYYSSVATLEADIKTLPKLDIIITDVIIKDTTCFETIQKIVDIHTDLKIFYITGYGSLDFTKSIQEIPGQVIEKPFSLFELHSKLENAFAQ